MTGVGITLSALVVFSFLFLTSDEPEFQDPVSPYTSKLVEGEECREGWVHREMKNFRDDAVHCVPLMWTDIDYVNRDAFQPILIGTVEGRVIEIEKDSAHLNYLTLESGNKIYISSKSDELFNKIVIDDIVTIGNYDYLALDCVPIRIHMNNGTLFFIDDDLYGTYANTLDVQEKTLEELWEIREEYRYDGAYKQYGIPTRESNDNCELRKDYQIESINN
jgi:hypothetical protein